MFVSEWLKMRSEDAICSVLHSHCVLVVQVNDSFKIFWHCWFYLVFSLNLMWSHLNNFNLTHIMFCKSCKKFDKQLQYYQKVLFFCPGFSGNVVRIVDMVMALWWNEGKYVVVNPTVSCERFLSERSQDLIYWHLLQVHSAHLLFKRGEAAAEINVPRRKVASLTSLWLTRSLCRCNVPPSNIVNCAWFKGFLQIGPFVLENGRVSFY